MSSPPGRRVVVALILLAPLIVTVSALLELANVARLATEQAAVEAEILSDVVGRQLDLIEREGGGIGLAAAGRDVRLQLILADAIAQAPSVLFVAVCDTSGVVVAHSMPSQIGERLERHAPLPRARDLAQSFAVALDLLRPGGTYEMYTPLTQDGQPYASIRVLVTRTFLWDNVKTSFWRGVVVSLGVVSVTILSFVLLSRIVMGRVRVLEEGVLALREGRFDAELETGADAFGRLANELNLLGRQFQEEGRSLDRAADLLGDGILTLGRDDEVRLVNTAASERLGIDREGARGRRLDDLLPPDHPLRHLREALRKAPGRSLSVPLGGDGDGYTAVAHRIEDPDDPDAGVLVEIKRSEEQTALLNLVDQSRVLARLGEMATGVAHELRNPLQTLTLELEEMEVALREDPAFGDRVKEIRRRVQRLDWAIRGFLKIARLRPPTATPLDVDGLLESVREDTEPDANLAGLEMQVVHEGTGGSISGDREVLQTALSNLVRNAIQAQPSRQGRIVLRRRRDGDTIRLGVEDTGPGIPTELRDRVFDLFYTTRTEGTGVGLAMVRQSVELHGGRVELDSTPGQGTTFTLVLPVRDSS